MYYIVYISVCKLTLQFHSVKFTMCKRSLTGCNADCSRSGRDLQLLLSYLLKFKTIAVDK